MFGDANCLGGTGGGDDDIVVGGDDKTIEGPDEENPSWFVMPDEVFDDAVDNACGGSSLALSLFSE